MGAKQRVNLPLIGGSSKARFPEQQSGRTVNMYAEPSDADAKAPLALMSRGGLFRFKDLTDIIDGDPSIRAMHVMQGRFFVVVAEKVCEILPDPSLTSFARLEVKAALTTTRGRVGLSDNGGKLVIGDGRFWVLDPALNTLTAVRNDGEEQLRGTFSGWIDGYTIYAVRDRDRFYYSAINDPLTVNGLDFETAEGDPDPILAMLIVNREIVFVGAETTEWWGDSGGADNAFARISGGFTQYGTAARWSVARLGNSLIMVGRNNTLQGAVWSLGFGGTEPVRISSPAVEACIAKVLFSALDRRDLTEQITAHTAPNGTREGYFLNLPAVPATVNSPAQPSMTWVYDPLLNLWTEAAYTNPATGLFERSLSDFHVLWNGRHYTGAYDRARIYEQSLNYYRDDTDPLIKFRETAGPISFDGRRFSLDRLEIQGNTGSGRDGGVQGSDPKLMVQFCWDGVWSNIVEVDWGPIGARDTRAVLYRCGSGRDLVIRVACSEPIPLAYVKALGDVTINR